MPALSQDQLATGMGECIQQLLMRTLYWVGSALIAFLAVKCASMYKPRPRYR